jgi:hypothetical protein
MNLEKLKKVLKTLLLVAFVGACFYFVAIHKIATKEIDGFEEKTLLYNQQNKTFFVEHLGEDIVVKTVRDTFYIDVEKVPDMKVYYFKHNIEDNCFFASGVEVFSGRYTPEELRHFVLKYKNTELFANCFFAGLFALIIYFISTLLYLIITGKV